MHTKTLTNAVSLLGIVCSLLLIGGCGGDSLNRAEISGKVTLDGKPVDTGMVTFMPKNTENAVVVGAKIVNGEYRLKRTEGPAVGTYSVRVSSVQSTGKMVKDQAIEGHTYEEYTETIPKPYSGMESPLTTEVNPGKNTADFDIKSP